MPNPRRTSILLVVRGLDPVGSGRQVELLAEGFARAGREVHVAVTTTGGAVPERLASRGIPVHRVGRRPTLDAAATARLVALALQLRPAAVLACGRSQCLATAAVRLAGSPVRLGGLIANMAGGGAMSRGLRWLDLVIASSDGVADSCRRHATTSQAIETIPPGIAADAGGWLSREQVAARLGLDPRKAWTLCVAPLVADSRLERLLWAIDQLGVVHKELQHVLVGSGPLLRRVRRLAHAQELAERLFVMPHCGLLPDLLSHTRLVWQSGDVAHGGAILDAMPHGVPVVAVESDAARQLIADRETGWIVPALPESEMPRRAFGILADESAAARLAAAARTRAAAEFPVERMVTAHMAAVERLVMGA